MKKLRYIITLIVSILLLGMTLYALFQTPAPATAGFDNNSASLMDSTAGVVWHDTISRGQELFQ
ncbi:MAG: hypothetical protein R3C61_20845 [Bacteroidia bacterium]